MLHVLWNTKSYFFWLLAVSLFCFFLERLWPWRKRQKAFRKQFWQDLFFLIFNGHYAAVLLAFTGQFLLQQTLAFIGPQNLPDPASWNLLAAAPLWVQFACFFLIKDFLEWCIHNLLHRIPFLWEFHKLHHSITELDWIGNFRFHWMEIVFYRSIAWFPLVILGVDETIILTIAVVSTLIGHLNHSNLKTSWGIFTYVFNSPRFHVWHHDVIHRGEHGKNFAIVFSFWDWLFGTAFWPKEEQPARLGFEKMEEFPSRLGMRLLYPFYRRKVISSAKPAR